MLNFGNGAKKFGSATPGKKQWAATVEYITPQDCIGYKNVVLMCGLNNARSKYIKTNNDIEDIYKLFKSKVQQIQYLNKSVNIVFCPLIPTRSNEINKKNMFFNKLVFSDMVATNSRVNTVHGFNEFLDSNGLLHEKFAKDHDQIHLNPRGLVFSEALLKRLYSHGRPM